ncbi:MAG TPA: PstS family phosphate ABC transporter substrate-binding protein [Candidatus Nanoarchaeia archaeon]|nr:PstS family phosphate ABC transporter substrate-binding protein [Candidatus Nanoarchaeia archaeon]
MKKYILALLLGLIIVTAGCSTQQEVTGAAVGETVKIRESLEIKGSDTMVQVVSALAEEYSRQDTRARMTVTGGGSGTGIAALINGEADIADSSRAMKEKEITEAKERGITPYEFIIARDMLSVVVNEDNPISELTFEQISSIFKGETTNWKEVGGNDQKITLYGRQSTSGTYVFFMEDVVKGDYSQKMRNLEGSQAIVEAVKQDENGVGYDGLGYVVDDEGKIISGIKAIKVARDQNSEYISPLDASKQAKYPISRLLYQYFAKKPEQGSALYNFLRFELSEKGQDIVTKSGFLPITVTEKKLNEQRLG